MLVDCCACVPAVGEQGTLGAGVDFSAEVVKRIECLQAAHADNLVIDFIPWAQAFNTPAGLNLVIGAVKITKTRFIALKDQPDLLRVFVVDGWNQKGQVAADVRKCACNALVGINENVLGSARPGTSACLYGEIGVSVDGDGSGTWKCGVQG
ncbi:hypothetical protein CUZ56_01475 [Saezia sanguinis]|uniref:Uncharacterized protein n=1 Tax=Saezia sanguinis TaxID=1965230 RepID=A0A433SD62_9BURK|nr:hypothetical protein CUZ56_01475 [Saezia sanguinis]